MCNFDNYSHEYKTRMILDLGKILLLPLLEARHEISDMTANSSLAMTQTTDTTILNKWM